jgi:tRNA (guanine-N7-)-methyltransferase
MREVLAATPGLVGGEVERWSDRPVTKFERKGVAAGRSITDFAFQRTATAATGSGEPAAG